MTLKTNDQREPLLVRAMYNFDDVQEGEIKLATGDVISVSKQVDENWWRGINLSHAEVPIGNFPKSFVKEIILPILKAGDELVLSISSFQTSVSGDLNFEANEVIVVEHFIDNDWCFGKIGNSSGIFPMSFTKKIISEIENNKVINNISELSLSPPVRSRKPSAVGLAVVNFEAQDEDEISFKDGNIIEIFESCNSSFAIGLNQSNPCNIGRIPLEFVYVIKGKENLNIPTNDSNSSSKFDWWKKPEAEKQIIEKLKQQVNDKIAPSFEEQTAPLETFDDNIDDYDNNFENPHDRLNDGVMLAGEMANLNEPKQSENVYGDDQTDCSVEESKISDNVPSMICSSSHLVSEHNVDSNLDRKLVNSVVEREMISQKCHLDTSSNFLVKCTDVLKSDNDANNDDMIFNALECQMMPDDCDDACDHVVDFNCGEEIEVDELKDRHDLQATSSSSMLITVDDNIHYSSYNEFKNSKGVNIQSDNETNGSNNNDHSKTENMNNKDDDNHNSFEAIPFLTSDSLSMKIINSMPSMQFHCGNSLESNTTSTSPLTCKQTNKHILKPKPSLKPKPIPRLKNGFKNIHNDFNHHKIDMQFPKRCNSQQNTIQMLKSESRDPKISLGNLIFKPSQGSEKMKSVFYINTPVENENVDNEDNHEANICLDLSSGSVIKFKKIAGQLDCNIQCSQVIPENIVNTSSGKPTKEAPTRPIKSNFIENFSETLSGAGALMMGPLDPDCLISSPSSSLQKNTQISPQNVLGEHIKPKRMLTLSRPQKPARTFESGIPDQNKKLYSISFNGDDDDGYQGGCRIDDNIIEDIERRIIETEQDLEKCIMEQSIILNEKYENKNMDLSDEAADNLKFYQANILGLTDGLTKLKAILKEIQQNDFNTMATIPSMSSYSSITSLPPPPPRMNEKIVRRKREEMRRKTISELIQTELDFLQSMSTCYDVFFDRDLSTECPSFVDLDFLFGNMHEVIDLSQKFYNLLETATNGKDFHEQKIGSCFEEIGENLKRIHGIYCRNHDEVISALTKLELSSEAQNYFHECLDKMRSKMMVFDLSAVLIKPVQRILKYPLLVGELIKNTEEDHVDYKHLRVADVIMKEVALHINEFKRRKDLVFKYKKPSDGGFSKKISKLTVHSIKKKLNRFMTPTQPQDEIFQHEEKKFKDMNIIVRNLIKDLSHYLDLLQVSLMDLESFCIDVSDHCRDENNFRQDLLKMEEAYSTINNHICSKFKNRVENDIMPTLSSLMVVYQGPREVIRKRHHKLIDFNNALNRLAGVPGEEQTKPMKDELDLLRRTFEAMNCQLLEDLPKLHQLSSSIIRDLIQLLARFQVEFVVQAKKELHDLLELDIFKSLSSSTLSITNVMNEFTLIHLKAVDRLSEVSFIPRSFNPSKVEDKKGSRKLSLQPLTSGGMNNDNSLKYQSDEEKFKVQNLFQSDNLYIVLKDFDGNQILDLSLTSGTLVGVIKREDPMKNKERFFVCDGAQKGFILRSYLKPFEDETNKEKDTEEDCQHDNLMNINDDDTINCNDDSSNVGSIVRHDDDDDDDKLMNVINITHDNVTCANEDTTDDNADE